MQADDEYGVRPPGFCLPPESRVGAVRLLVTDLGRSIDYYQQVIGLHLHDRTSEAAALGGRDAPFLSLHTRNGLRRARRGAFGLYHFAILLPDRPALGRFAAHLSQLTSRIGMADHLVSEALYLTDPDGLGIEVYADRPRSAWQHRGHELLMTTDPLDVRDLIAAAGETRWDEAPLGTTIGHMHLHVGSLDEAERFYHRGLGFTKTVWSYAGALFLAAGGYHHHLGTNVWARGPSAEVDEARLLEWEIVVPTADAASSAAASLRAAGYSTADSEAPAATDPWGTRLRIVPRRNSGDAQ
jgi:catechol 2,3-dioxygenase